jgi:hypothetical protein
MRRFSLLGLLRLSPPPYARASAATGVPPMEVTCNTSAMPVTHEEELLKRF